jgi:ATP-dependent RNA circularization protein (DNA/RNA ligase family)
MKDKLLGRKSYGSIPHLSGSKMGQVDKICEKGQENIATRKVRDYRDLIIVQEKVDGSNVGIAKVNGEIVPLSRAGYVANTSPYKQHHVFYHWVMENRDRFNEILKDGERLCGEWLLQVHGTHYNLIHEPFVAFDIIVETKKMDYHSFLLRVLKYDFTIPNLVHLGQPITVDRVMKRLEKSGHGALEKPEGAVWRVEREGKVDFLIKYVRPDKIDGLYMKEEKWNNGVEKYIPGKYL